VGLIRPEAYARDVADAVRFLRGGHETIISELEQQMHAASAELGLYFRYRLLDALVW
jgi:excinuclease UvrABC nuclease subunit